MKKIFSIICIFPFLFMHAQDCNLRLTGHVHSSQTHENLPQAYVMLAETGRMLVTDQQGDFVFDSLCPGSYTLLVSHSSFDSAVRTVNLTRRMHIDVDLVPAEHRLSEIRITGSRVEQRTGIRGELSGRELEEERIHGLAGALGRIAGVSILQTGATISKPVIHGLHGNRVLTINNGVRQEGQQWGNEHAPEIDPFIAGRLTVVKGVEELRYGSDAIGGVVLVEPRSLRMTPGYNAEFNAVYLTNNRQYIASAIFEQQLRRLSSFTYRVQGTYKRGANIAAPRYRLNNTATEEANFSLTAGWRREHFNFEVYYSMFNTRIAIFTGSHIGNLTDLQAAIASPAPDPVYTGEKSYSISRPSQEVNHQLLKLRTGFDAGNHKFNLLLAGQFNNRMEYDVIRNQSVTAPQIDLEVFTFTEELNWERPSRSNFSGMAGIQAVQQENSYSGRYLIPNYRSYAYGAYIIEKFTRAPWDLQAGIRFDTRDITTNRLQTASQTFTEFRFDFNTVAASFNAGYQVLPQWKINSTWSYSMRAPHVNELLTNGIHHGAGTYEVGDITLKPERAFNLALNNRYGGGGKVFSAELTLYRNHITNFIYQQPRPDEPVLTIRGAFPKIIYNATDAVLYGSDLMATLHFLKHMTWNGRFSMLRARDLRIDDWLIGMPADRIMNELEYTLPAAGRLRSTVFSAELQNVFRQTRVPSDDKLRDYQPPPPGYTLLNAGVATTVMMGQLPLNIGINGRNLLNRTYREYLNSFRYFTDEMGRNISVRFRIGLQHFY